MTLTDTAIEVDGEKMALAGHTLVLTARHPQNVEKAIGYLVVDPVAAFPGLGRKLPHYGKYSYLGFDGTEPVNVLKGQWQQTDSPLRVDVRAQAARLASGPGAPQGGALPRLEPLPADVRRALAELPPTFSQKALTDHVAFLADPARQGRGPGSDGHEAAAKYIADRFKAYGLAPGGDSGSFFQSFSMPVGERREPRTVANVVGIIPGTKPEWKDQSVLVTAHYDHLGLGWPDVHKGDEGKVHPGADDNASGVAVMLELANTLARAEKPSRSIVFVAFTGEEAGLLGSAFYVEHAGAFPIGKVIGAINLDTVGRLGDQRLSVIGTGTASEWQHIFRGASFVTGVESRNIPEAMQASDQMSFIRKGVPAVQIFTGAHGDYHRPGDTADKIDGPGLVKVATFVREGVIYLAERAEPLTNTIAGRLRRQGGCGGQAGSAACGGPPARQARQLRDGARLRVRGAGRARRRPRRRLAGAEGGCQGRRRHRGDRRQAVANLQAFSAMLGTFAPGQTVKATVVRGGKELTVPVTLVER